MRTIFITESIHAALQDIYMGGLNGACQTMEPMGELCTAISSTAFGTAGGYATSQLTDMWCPGVFQPLSRSFASTTSSTEVLTVFDGPSDWSRVVDAQFFPNDPGATCSANIPEDEICQTSKEFLSS